jgi:hypothetical protein
MTARDFEACENVGGHRPPLQCGDASHGIFFERFDFTSNSLSIVDGRSIDHFSIRGLLLCRDVESLAVW